MKNKLLYKKNFTKDGYVIIKNFLKNRVDVKVDLIIIFYDVESETLFSRLWKSQSDCSEADEFGSTVGCGA